ncbi:nucleoid-associated protein [Paenarthrobacter nicotinovorans]|uniref:nucleoid-associated protein n=1 Tax=Paenarthrobacter nicotinovorans TaxID=29320 RepID=UPI003DA41575
MHEVPKGKFSTKDDVDVTLSSELTPLQIETRRFIEDNMLKFALKQPRQIKRDTTATSNTPDLVSAIINDADQTFVKASQELARGLYRSQTANSPSGILVVASAEMNGRDSVLLMKAEHQEGMRLRRDESTGRLDLEHLNELIVGHNSRIYKIAVMELADDDTIIGQMVDQQNGVMYADFFLHEFLGCQLADRAEIQTKTFMDAAIRHFNESITDPEKAARYAGALSAYMHAPGADFQAGAFADDYLEADDRDDFLDAIPESVGDNVIRKDMSLVAGKGAGVRIIGHGFTVVASNEAFETGKITVTKDETGETVIRLSGDLRQMNFGPLPKSSQ